MSTTIVETGLDIPNANTLIVDGAERMGLSQLYQLRGRVGRSNRTSYAFLMYRKDKLLSEDAEKRLKAIREFTELGSGIRIAMRDLEIRGAGNVLGAEQHGQMQAVGYDLYCKLLSQAVRFMQGQAQSFGQFTDIDAARMGEGAQTASGSKAYDVTAAEGENVALTGEQTAAGGNLSAADYGASEALSGNAPLKVETGIDCDIDAFIPNEYISDEYHKLDIYKRIAEIETGEEYEDMQDELTDRFGDPPKSVQNLLDIVRIKSLARKAYITELDIRSGYISMHLHPKADIKVEAIPKLIEQEKGRLLFYRGSEPKLVYTDKHASYKGTAYMMNKAEELIACLVKDE